MHVYQNKNKFNNEITNFVTICHEFKEKYECVCNYKLYNSKWFISGSLKCPVFMGLNESCIFASYIIH